jgi:hypothetical protein
MWTQYVRYLPSPNYLHGEEAQGKSRSGDARIAKADMGAGCRFFFLFLVFHWLPVPALGKQPQQKGTHLLVTSLDSFGRLSHATVGLVLSPNSYKKEALCYYATVHWDKGMFSRLHFSQMLQSYGCTYSGPSCKLPSTWVSVSPRDMINTETATRLK